MAVQIEARICAVDGCGKPKRARGVCTTHWWRLRKHGSLDLPPRPSTLLVRLDAKTLRTPGGCWQWLGEATTAGYGTVSDGPGRRYYVHRLSYERHVGPIPEGLQIDHLCRNTRCLNPTHLDVVTPSVNSQRAKEWHRASRCPNGHLYEAGSYRITPGGWRQCIACARASSTRGNHKRRGLPKRLDNANAGAS